MENSLQNHEEFLKRRVILASRPRMLFIELTRACNLSCPICRDQMLIGKHLAMSDEILSRIEEELLPYVKCVNLNGLGESTLDPRFLEWAKYLSIQGIGTRVYTNLCTNNYSYWYKVGSCNIDIAISLEAANPDTYEKFRRRGKFNRFLRNLKAVRKARRDYQSKSDTYFSVVVSEDNIFEIPEIIILAAQNNIPTVRLNPITLDDYMTKYPIIGISKNKIAELKDVLDRTKKIAMKLKVKLQLGATLESSGLGGFDICLHPWSYVVIQFDGSVVFCDHLVGHSKTIMGNILEEQFMNIWNNDRYKSLRQMHIYKKFSRLRSKNIECDWCYNNRYADCEYLFERKYQPLNLCEI